jgi:hypothetical protein
MDAPIRKKSREEQLADGLRKIANQIESGELSVTKADSVMEAHELGANPFSEQRSYVRCLTVHIEGDYGIQTTGGRVARKANANSGN